jgi:hypothetical protein
MDLFALATVTTRPDEAGEPPPTKFYELRDNLLCSKPSTNFDTTAYPISPPGSMI